MSTGPYRECPACLPSNPMNPWVDVDGVLICNRCGRQHPEKIEQDMDRALRALEGIGLDLSNLVIGIIGDPKEKGGMPYDIHVGDTEDRDVAIGQSYVMGVMRKVVDQQVAAVLDPKELCPSCFSVRYGHVQRFDGEGRMSLWMECLACGYEHLRPRS